MKAGKAIQNFDPAHSEFSTANGADALGKAISAGAGSDIIVQTTWTSIS
jgi:hypothetical protein